MPLFNIGDVVVWSQFHDTADFEKERQVHCKVVGTENQRRAHLDGTFTEEAIIIIECIFDTTKHIEPGHRFDANMSGSHWRYAITEEEKGFGVVGVHGNDRQR